MKRQVAHNERFGHCPKSANLLRIVYCCAVLCRIWVQVLGCLACLVAAFVAYTEYLWQEWADTGNSIHPDALEMQAVAPTATDVHAPTALPLAATTAAPFGYHAPTTADIHVPVTTHPIVKITVV